MLRKLFPVVVLGTSLVPDIDAFVPSTRRSALLFTTSNGARQFSTQHCDIALKAAGNANENEGSIELEDPSVVLVITDDNVDLTSLIGCKKRFLRLASKDALTESNFWMQIISSKDEEGKALYPRELKLFGEIAGAKNFGTNVKDLKWRVRFYLMQATIDTASEGTSATLWDLIPQLRKDEYVEKVVSAMADVVSPTIKECLANICKYGHATLKSLTTVIDHYYSEDCFFIAHSGVDFRHEGTSGEVPPRVFLQRVSYQENLKIALFASSSGSGKTVELAGSGYTRRSHLAVFVKFDGDIEIERDADAEYHDHKRACQSLAEKIFRFHLRAVLDQSSNVFTAICQAAVHTNETLKLVICIDEAGAYPLLVRSLIANQTCNQRIVAKELCTLSGFSEEILNIEVLFAVAGTGIPRTTAGTNWFDNSFAVQQTSASIHPDKVYKALNFVAAKTQGIERPEDVAPYDTIQANHPVLGTLLKNARMCSIALPQIWRVIDFMGMPSFEAIVIDHTIKLYMRSNGMKDLCDKPRESAIVGARALAVYLFQKPYTFNDIGDVEEDILNIMYGPAFEEYNDLPPSSYPNADADSDAFSTLEIVQTYGLLEARPFSQIVNTVERPFDLSPSMQLVALYLMQLDPECVEMGEPSPFGFGMLSTHIIKSVIAASVTIREDERPTLGEIFKEHLNVGKGGKNVGAGGEEGQVAARWDAMKDMIAVSSHVAGADEADEHPLQCWMTMQQRVEQAIKRDIKGKDWVRADGKLNEATVLNLQYNDNHIGISQGWKNYYAPPVASVSFGNGQLAGGYVTFMAKQKTGDGDASVEAEKVSIMIQAQADLSDFEVSKLNDRAELCYDPCLDSQYGTKRLLVVAGSDDVVFETSTGTVKRDFVSFGVDRLAVKEMMAALEDKRKKAKMIKDARTEYRSVGGRGLTYADMVEARKDAKEEEEATAAQEAKDAE